MQPSQKPVTPRPSATVMVVRPSQQEGQTMELFMLRRHSKSKFLPDRYVFPGGALEPHDSDARTLRRLYPTPDFDSPRSLFRDLPGQGSYEQAITLDRAREAGLYVATFRELFEEAGVILALQEENRESYNVQESEERQTRFAAYRKALHAGEISFVEILEREKLLLDFNRLTYYSHWITPKVEPIRFDTRFFLAVAQPDQMAESDYRETTHGVWISPQQALAGNDEGTFNLIYPTILHLRRLAAQPSIESLVETARSKTVITVSPDAFPMEEGFDFRLPGEVADRW